MASQTVKEEDITMSKQNTVFSCYLIGRDNLVLQCSEELLNAGHHVLGIFSNAKLVKKWAASRKIPCSSSILKAKLIDKFDYLFSIVNDEILPDNIIKSPQKFAINFHDSPLPTYAGVYATSWAILNGEKRHGITWHIIDQGIDTGDILKKKYFDIDPDETAFSLNIKCYEVAIKSFKQLIKELAAGSYLRQPQDLTKRSYYGLHKKPIGNGWINWRASASSIEQLVRALNFGGYANHFSLPKFLMSQKGYILKTIKRLNIKTDKPPGTIVRVTYEGIQVTTHTQDIILTQILLMDSSINNTVDILKKNKLREGYMLSSPQSGKWFKFKNLSVTLSKHERFWVKELARLVPTGFSSMPLINAECRCKKLIKVDTISFASELNKYPKDLKSDSSSILLTLVLLYLARINNQNTVSVWLGHEVLQKSGALPFIQKLMPFTINFREVIFAVALQEVQKNLLKLSRHVGYLKDLYLRSPQIQNISHPGITIILNNKIENYLTDIKNNLVISISKESSTIEIWVNKKRRFKHLDFIFQNITHHLNGFLENMNQTPNKNIWRLSYIPENDIQQMLSTWSATKVYHSNHKLVFQLFEDQVISNPQGVAIEYGKVSITFLRLNEQANQLAHYLCKRGLPADSSIAIIFERSPHFIISILGILKAEFVYVPIDPDYPNPRIEYMLQDSQVELIITERRHETRLHQLFDVKRVIAIDKELPIINECSKENRASSLSPLSRCSVMYTSGSTGTPKGIEILHQGITRLVKGANYITVDQSDTVAHLSNVTFDASTFEIWSALLNGAKLLILSQDVLLSSAILKKQLRKNHVSILWLTSALFDSFMSIEPDLVDGIKYLLVGGDVVSRQAMKKLLRRKHQPKYILNGYGPTENTTFTTTYLISATTSLEHSIPIGKPISNTSVFVLDKNQQLVPIGMVGELYVGGIGLARGYINKPELTNQKFISHPLVSNQKLYKTGDLVRWLPDGNLEYVGRIDYQVKLRGFRIELQEIESILNAYFQIENAVVLIHKSGLSDQLAAFVILASRYQEYDQSLIALNISNYLKSKLPDYMIPQTIHILEKFPVTGNGKVNRKSLELCSKRLLFENKCIKLPENEFQTILRRVWCQIFKREISITDNFFHLGGDSIVAMQIASKATQMGYPIMVKHIFSHPTIEQLSCVTLETNHLTAEQKKCLTRDDIPLTPIQHWFFEKTLVHNEQFSHACIVNLPHDVDFLLVEICLNVLIQHYDAFHLRYHYVDNQWKQFLSKDKSSSSVIDIVHSTQTQNSSFFQRLILDMQQKFHLTDGPLFFIKLINNHLQKCAYMVLVAHHLLIDGVSWRVFLSHLERLYIEGGSEKDGNPLAISTSFQEWAYAVTEHAHQTHFGQYQHYWKQLSQYSNKIPYDYFNTDNLEKDSQVKSSVLDRTQTSGLLANTNSSHLKIHELLLGIIVKVFSTYSQEEAIVIHLERHGRESLSSAINVESSIGWFTNLFPAYFVYDRDLSLSDHLSSIKQQLNDANQYGLYYGVLYYLKNKRLNCNPEISFNYWGQFDSTFSVANHFHLKTLRLVSHPENTRTHIINVEASIINGQLRISLVYNKKIHQQQTIQNLLRQIIEHLKCPIFGKTANEARILIRQPNLKSYSLAPMQKGLLFHSINSPGCEAYAVQFMWNISNNIKIHLLRAAFNELLGRIDILRSYFDWKNSSHPTQHIASHVEIPWHEYDWSMHADTKKELIKRLAMFLKLDRQANFSLLHPPLMRVTLIKYSTEIYKIVFTIHHILIDGWSASTLMKALGHIYQSLSTSSPIELDPVLPLSSYISWLDRQNLSAVKRQWKRYLSQFTTPTELFCLKQHDSTSPIDYAQYSISFSKKKLDAIKQFCGHNQLTLSTVLQGVWGILLGYYNQREDVIFGVTVSIRQKWLRDAESIVGPLINTIPLRIKIDNNQTFIEYFRNVQSNFHEILEWSDVPISDIQSVSDIERHANLFNSILVVENYPTQKIPGFDINFETIEITDPTHYPLVITGFLSDQFVLRFGYDVSKVDLQHLKSIINHFQWILNNLYSLHLIRLSSLDLLTAHEKRKMLVDWNETDFHFNFHQTVHEQFELQARQTPTRIAIIFNENKLSYAELNEKANQIAHYLSERRIKNGDRIVLCLERGLEMVTGMFATLKLGAAYIPVDPGYPEIRVQYMLDNCSPTFVLTDSNTSKKFSNIFASVQSLSLNEDSIFTHHSKYNLNRVVKSESLMYVIYTSGSTGEPKGVMVEHRSVVNFLYGMQEQLKLRSHDCLLAITPISFDISTLEIYLPLMNGLKCVISDQATISDGRKLKALLETQKISILQATPVTWKMLLEAGWRNKEKIKILCGGEPLPLSLSQKLCAISSQVNNLYGPTETTVWSTIKSVSKKDLIYPIMPIGRPIFNTKVYVLDKNMNCLPIGMIGDLYIGGSGLARGYLNQPALTNQKFVANPYIPGEKIYKTEDLARWLPNGQLEYIGRVDDQVKIRGFRIELGEIQAILEKYDQVKQAIVIMSAYMGQEPELIACLIPYKKESFMLYDLQRYLRKTIPAHMIPAKFVFFDTFPLSSNHKIDKKALLKFMQDIKVQDSNKSINLPKSAEEKLIAGIWSKLLKIPVSKIAKDSSFFELGGHSLSALQMISEFYRHFNIELEVKDLFENQTITDLSKIVVSLSLDRSALVAAMKKISTHDSSMICLKATGNRSPLFLVHPVGGTIFWYISLAKYFDENRPLYAIQDPGISAVDIPFQSVSEMAEHYINLIKQIQPSGPYFIGGASAGANISHEMAYQLIKLGEKIEFIALLDGWAHYPKILKNREIFESIMMRQYYIMEEKFSTKGIHASDKLFNLQWQRSQMSNCYIPNRIDIQLTLFKSLQTLPIFKYMDNTFNHWKPYSSRPIKQYIVPGNHESMFVEPNVFVLAQLLNESLNKNE